MRRPDPTSKEINFELDEMFFSTTDHQGVILDGNQVFVNISKYSRSELIGKPHSIIRHPDMPKVVFKALWSTILAGDVICAYVKNLAKDGSFYWVFATVIPIGDEFLSIRMKPTTHLKGIVEELYKELLKIEKSSGIDASLKALVAALNSLGFADYGAFVLAAISAELSSRYKIQSSNIEKSISKDLLHCKESLFSIFTLLNNLSSHTASISSKVAIIAETSKKIEFSALNTIIEAERLGETGRALSVVAQHITNGADEAKAFNKNVSTLTQKMLGDLGDFKAIQLSIALSTLQAEMLSCFINQTADDNSLSDTEAVKKNELMLFELIEKTLNDSRPSIEALGHDIDLISSELEKSAKVLMTLNFVQKTGSIETARLVDSSIFSQLFDTITNLLKESKIFYEEFSVEINNSIKKDILEVIRLHQDVTRLISKLK